MRLLALLNYVGSNNVAFCGLRPTNEYISPFSTDLIFAELLLLSSVSALSGRIKPIRPSAVLYWDPTISDQLGPAHFSIRDPSESQD